MEYEDLTMCRHLQFEDIPKMNAVSKPLAFSVPTWLQWVLDVEHGGPVAIHQVLLNLVFGNVAASVLYSDACFQVVEVAAVQLKEFNEQNANVDVGTAHVLPVVKLEKTRPKQASKSLQFSRQWETLEC